LAFPISSPTDRLAGITGRTRGVNSDGDHQKDIDLAADAMMRAALRATPVAAVLSEETGSA